MKYIVAVSGGVDSVVLLDILAHKNNQNSDYKLIVAHVDHGIRSDSDADARFVEALAKRYNLPFVSTRLELGASASELVAREARYDFLREQARKFNARIVTAHHADDLVETVAINLLRGTGWRGLAVFGASDIARPLVGRTKADLYDYAISRKLEWVEDETNLTDAYLRNRLRGSLPLDVYGKIAKLWGDQKALARQIEQELTRFVGRNDRYFFTMLPESVGIELMRAVLASKTDVRSTRPQAYRALMAIKTGRAGTVHEIYQQTKLRLSDKHFVVDTSEKML